MAMQSTEKHGPAVDDALKNTRRQAPAGTRHDGATEEGHNDDQPRFESDPAADTYIGVRSEVARFLGPSAFPGDKATLCATARDNDASEDVMRLLADLPEDVTFQTTQEVVDAVPLNGTQPDG